MNILTDRLHWLTSFYLFYKIRHILFKNPSEPWFARGTITFLLGWLKNTHHGVEFGGGNSTSWFLQHCKDLITIESNIEWFNKISSVNKTHIKSGKLIIHLEDEPYVIDDNKYDFIVVDGGNRSSHALLSLNLLKDGGLLIIDDAERYIPVNSTNYPKINKLSHINDEWELFAEHTKDWKSLEYNDGITVTKIFINE